MSLPLVIVPVFNAFERLEACLDSIARTVPQSAEVILIDDASTDSRVRPLLQAWVGSAGLNSRLVCHQQNRGFVATANSGMRLAATDLVLLNSDTEVTDGWLQRLGACLDSDDRIATATPWSNNGEIVSLPQFCVANPVPGNPEMIAEVISGCGKPLYPDMPTAVGFCMAISYKAIEQIGLFDEEKIGMRNVLCDDAYVVHHGNASFGPLNIRPDETSMQRLLAKHPDYHSKVSEFIRQDPFSKRRQEIVRQLEKAGVKAGAIQNAGMR